MAQQNNSVCAICGKGYYLCISCKETKELTPWKIHTDTSEHYKIYQILHGYSVGVYDKEDAKSKLHMVDLSDLEELRDDIKSAIKSILDDGKTEIQQETLESTQDKPTLLKGSGKRKISNTVES